MSDSKDSDKWTVAALAASQLDPPDREYFWSMFFRDVQAGLTEQEAVKRSVNYFQALLNFEVSVAA